MSAPFEMARRLSNRPLALVQSEVDLLAAALRGQTPAPFAFGGSTASDRERRYGLIDGVAIIPVKGILFQGSWSWPWATGYEWIRTGLLAAIADPEVRAIVLDIDSPGGEVAGCFDLVDTIYACRGTKPIWAILSEHAYSAAYAIASAADRIIVPRTGGTGSIGVIWMHVDWSQAMDKAGVKVTFITYGDHKAEGNPCEPLSKEARDRFQADIDTMGDLFVETVARNRNLSATKVRGTQAATYLGERGVAIGLADAVMAPDAAFQALLDQLG
ncbi:S49 family peptidase [Azospirillum brasilense]|nr:S49 family peptidase [Azospirillum brasilense]